MNPTDFAPLFAALTALVTAFAAYRRASSEEWQAITKELRSEVSALRDDLDAERKLRQLERAELAEVSADLAALRADVTEALRLLRGLPGAEPAVAILDKPTKRTRRKKADGELAEAA